jgi:AraC-like DNA-binding protein
VHWEELTIDLAVQAVALSASAPGERGTVPSNTHARITRAVRIIDCSPDQTLSIGELAHVCGLSPYYFLRTFEQAVGVTPHQYILRARLRDAAARLAVGPSKIVDIAFACGFGDVSNFNRAFRKEFGVSPREYRRTERTEATEGTDQHGGTKKRPF